MTSNLIQIKKWSRSRRTHLTVRNLERTFLTISLKTKMINWISIPIRTKMVMTTVLQAPMKQSKWYNSWIKGINLRTFSKLQQIKLQLPKCPLSNRWTSWRRGRFRSHREHWRKVCQARSITPSNSRFQVACSSCIINRTLSEARAR